MTIELTLSPDGRLAFSEVPAELEPIHRLFAISPSAGLLHLSLNDVQTPLGASALFWQSFGRKFIGQICRTQGSGPLAPPNVDELLSLAPFMRGRDYLTAELLVQLWREMEQQLHEELKHFAGSLQEYLAQYSARWNLIGRVCFHLAEDKRNPERPFAFLATYTTQLASETATPQHLPLKKAFQESIQTHNKATLLALLMPVQRAALQSPFVKQLFDSKAIFEVGSWSVRQAHEFLQAIPVMEESGILVRVPNWWNSGRPSRLRAEVHLGDKPPSTLGLSSVLDFDVRLSLGDGITITHEEWEAISRGGDPLVQLKGKWVELDRDKLQSVLAHWDQLKRSAKNGLSMAEGLRLLTGLSSAADSANESALDVEKEWAQLTPGSWLKQMLSELKNPDACKPPYKELQGTLRPYQHRGVQWLWTLYRLRLGGCLADDMGLGKTIQVLSLLLAIKAHRPQGVGKPHLLVVPASLLGNWQAEAARFAPTLRLSVAHTSASIQIPWSEADLILTTYGYVHRFKDIQDTHWDLVILDEAQAIKNPAAKQTRSTKALHSEMRLALTGTPIENRLGDLWSLFDFTSPGLLGSSKAFAAHLKNADRAQFTNALRKLTQPYILRRLKSDKTIISDLPDKTEMKAYCSLSLEQVRLYTQTIQELAEKLKSAEGMQRRGAVLSSLMRLKQICNHPDQWQGFGAFAESASGKWARLRAICEEIAEKQEKVLIFTQFKEVMPALFSFLTTLFSREGLMLHGDTPIPKRAQLVQQFQEPDGPPFFLLSLKAGGTGLNLTRASHVIHFDRWWNPAVENQATDRAYRIGQKHPVLVHQFICQGTIEEKIDALIASKKTLSNEVLEGEGELLLTELSNDEVLKMVSLDIGRALQEE